VAFAEGGDAEEMAEGVVRHVGYWPALALAEAGAVVVEALFYRLIAAPGLRQALIVSALANGASSGLGLLLDAFGIV
jgi:hypothetical protein